MHLFSPLRRRTTSIARRTRSARGLSLVEVIVASTVLSIVLLPIGAFAVRSVGVTRDASESLVVSQRVATTNMMTSQILMNTSDVVVMKDFLEFIDPKSARDTMNYYLDEPAAYNNGAEGDLIIYRNRDGSLGYMRLSKDEIIVGDTASERMVEMDVSDFAVRRISEHLLELRIAIETPGARTSVEMTSEVSLFNAGAN